MPLRGARFGLVRCGLQRDDMRMCIGYDVILQGMSITRRIAEAALRERRAGEGVDRGESSRGCAGGGGKLNNALPLALFHY